MKLTLQIPDIDYEITHGGKPVMEGTLPSFSATGYTDAGTVKSLGNLITSMVISRLKIDMLEQGGGKPGDVEKVMSELNEIKLMPGSDGPGAYAYLERLSR